MKLFIWKDKLYWPKLSGPVGDQNREIHINVAVFTCMLTSLLPDRNSGGPQNFSVVFLVIRRLHAMLHCPRKTLLRESQAISITLFPFSSVGHCCYKRMYERVYLFLKTHIFPPQFEKRDSLNVVMLVVTS